MTLEAKASGKKTIADWLAAPEERRLELIDGNLIARGPADRVRSTALGGLDRILRPAFDRRDRADHQVGWWIAGSVSLQLGENGYLPELVGWRRDRVPAFALGRPVTVRPDWVCQVPSDLDAPNDFLRKQRRYHQGGVSHYWIIDPYRETLEVFRAETPGYLHVLTAERNETVRAEPFDAIELRVGLLFGDDPAD